MSFCLIDEGYDSTFGVGKSCPDPTESTFLDNDVLVPYGACQPAPNVKKSDLLYNEFIVYDVAQVKLRFLVEVEFEFKEK
jgi:poly [ADP-ribose] polymerase